MFFERIGIIVVYTLHKNRAPVKISIVKKAIQFCYGLDHGPGQLPVYLRSLSPSSISSQSKDGITPDMQAIAASPCADAQIFTSSIS